MSQKDEINMREILEICADDEKWRAWLAQFYTKDQINIRLVHALFEFSPDRRKTKELSNLKNQTVEGYIESDCIACRKYLELCFLDPTTFFFNKFGRFYETS